MIKYSSHGIRNYSFIEIQTADRQLSLIDMIVHLYQSFLAVCNGRTIAKDNISLTHILQVAIQVCGGPFGTSSPAKGQLFPM